MLMNTSQFGAITIVQKTCVYYSWRVLEICIYVASHRDADLCGMSVTALRLRLEP